jgi:hypothetical protein
MQIASGCFYRGMLQLPFRRERRRSWRLRTSLRLLPLPPLRLEVSLQCRGYRYKRYRSFFCFGSYCSCCCSCSSSSCCCTFCWPEAQSTSLWRFYNADDAACMKDHLRIDFLYDRVCSICLLFTWEQRNQSECTSRPGAYQLTRRQVSTTLSETTATSSTSAIHFQDYPVCRLHSSSKTKTS